MADIEVLAEAIFHQADKAVFGEVFSALSCRFTLSNVDWLQVSGNEMTSNLKGTPYEQFARCVPSGLLVLHESHVERLSLAHVPVPAVLKPHQTTARGCEPNA